MQTNKVVLLFSGGMDSTVLLYKAKKHFNEIHTLTFDYNQRHKRELDAAQQILSSIGMLSDYTGPITNKVLDVSFIRDIAGVSSLTNDDIATPNVKDMRGEAQPKSYVPNRNMMFLSIATAYAESIGASKVWYGAAEADSLAGYYDGSEEWIAQMNNTLAYNRANKIEIEAPLISMSKKDIVNEAVRLRVPLKWTYTCYSGQELPDAESASSSLRLRGFIDAGYKDPIQYKQQEKLNEIYTKANCKDYPA